MRPSRIPQWSWLAVVMACALFPSSGGAAKAGSQKTGKAPASSKPPGAVESFDFADPLMLRGLEWRCIGPYRGGRVTAVSGVEGQRNVYYFGATGGGLWKTTDGGSSWRPIADGQLGTGSVGAVAVAPSDPNVIYAGMGEACIRGNV